MRIDRALFERGLTRSRSRAALLLASGDVTVNGRVVTKASVDVSDADELAVRDFGYVGRGGLKLEEALKNFSIDCRGKTALDIGASTGGFTQCLLENGAAHVFAVDVGHGQMAPELAQDARVTLFENTNAKTITPALFSGQADLAVMDVSFISQTAIYPALFSCVKEDGPIVTLFKPQFEVGPRYLNKHGIVRDTRVLPDVLRRVDESARACGRGIRGICASPIAGGDGNREYLLLLGQTDRPFDPEPFF